MTPKHSNLGPSSAERWMNCPGSVAALATLKRSPETSSHAAEGTVAHGLCDEFVSGELTLQGLMMKVGTSVKQDGFDITIDDEMVNAVLVYADAIWADKKALAEKGIVYTGVSEARVYAKSVSPDLYGTADYVLYAPGILLKVYDFKYGKGVVVDVEENKQMAIYALAAMETMAGVEYPDGGVELVVIQPRAGGAAVRRWSPTAGWSHEFFDKLTQAVAATKQPNAPRIASAKACQWCGFKGACAEAYAFTQKSVALDFADEPIKPEAGKLPDISALPLEVLVKALDHEDYVTGWFEAVRSNLKQRLEAGLPVPGYKLVEGRSNRKFIDELKVIEAFEDSVGVDRLLEPRKLISPAKLEKIVGKGKLDAYTFKPEGGKSIAKDSDPRPEVKNAAELDFAPTPLTIEDLS